MSGRELSGIYHRADLYDAVYRGRGKAYQTDADAIANLVFERNDSASSLLDVACGTGAHLRHFAGMFAHVEGVDLAPDMVRAARASLPAVPVHVGDMSSFELDRTFDAVTCLFSSIGYLDSADRLDAALNTFARHLNPGGVIVLEPWYFPENATSGSVISDLVTVEGRTISRVSRAVLGGEDQQDCGEDQRAHHMEVHYLVAHADAGIAHFTDTHILSVFGRGRYEAAFAKAGCQVKFLDPAKTGRPGPGLFVGVKDGAAGRTP